MAVSLMPRDKVMAMYSRAAEAMPDLSAFRRRFPNCPYGDDPRQAVDIYLPDEGPGPFPVVLFLHGGGWSGGARNDAQLAPFIKAVRHGYAFISIGYRLVPAVRYPECLHDVFKALQWISENADTYLLDASRCALCGASAGAQLALMASYNMNTPAFGGRADNLCMIRAVVDQFGPTDFLKKHAHYDESGYPRADDPESGEPEMIDAALGLRLDDYPQLERFVSPIFSVHAGVPPALIMHGRFDPSVPYQQSVELFEKINALAGPGRAELWLSDEFLHADPGYAGEEGEARIFTFLDKHLRR